MPGKNPASARPRLNRRIIKLIAPWVNTKAPKTGPRSKHKDIGAEADILVHGQRCEPNVDAVQITDEIENKAEWQQPQIDLLHGLLFNRRFHGFLQSLIGISRMLLST